MLLPVYRAFYGVPIVIRLVSTDGEFSAPVLRTNQVEQDLVPHRSCKGGCQGCPLATPMSILPYHEALHRFQKQRPTARIIADADDTYMQLHWRNLYQDFELKQRITKETSGHITKPSKVNIYCAAYHTPREYTFDPDYHHTTDGFKAVRRLHRDRRLQDRQLLKPAHQAIAPT